MVSTIRTVVGVNYETFQRVRAGACLRMVACLWTHHTTLTAFGSALLCTTLCTPLFAHHSRLALLFGMRAHFARMPLRTHYDVYAW